MGKSCFGRAHRDGELLEGYLAIKFHQHVVNLCGRLTSGCFSVRATFLELGYEMTCSVYFALVESNLRYALPFWGACPQYLWNAVLHFRREAWVVLFQGLLAGLSLSSMVYCLLTLPAIYILETACLIHKNRNKFPQLVMRTVYRFHIRILVFSRDSLIYKGIKIYNHLDHNFKRMVDLREF